MTDSIVASSPAYDAPGRAVNYPAMVRPGRCLCRRPLLRQGKDIVDTCADCRDLPEYCGCEPLPSPLAGIRDGSWLDKQEFPDLEYVIPGLIPEGLTLLIGPPKAGKSWMLLSFCLSVASGGVALSAIRMPAPKRVLYLALEDGDRRMQARCRTLLEGKDPIPPKFHYVTRVLPGEMHLLVGEFLDIHPDTGMIVIDTLGKVMPDSRPGESAYQRDYRVAAGIKQIADDHPGLSVIVAHHDRKATSDDFVDSVSGTHGIAGAADTIAVLARKRQSQDALLKITGRDVPEAEYALTLDQAGTWSLAGMNLAAAMAEAERRSEQADLGDTSTQIMNVIREHPDGISRAMIQKSVGENVQVDVYLMRLVNSGRIIKSGRGVYAPVKLTG